VKNKKITVSQVDLNTGDQLKIPCSLSGEDDPNQREASPKFIHFINGTGKLIEINLLSKTELSEYTTSTGNFEGMGIANGATYNSMLLSIDPEDSNNPIDYILVKKAEAGDVSAVLDVYCINYV